jgi:hypothetical protein
LKKVDTKQWLEAETKKVISDTTKYNRDSRYKKELDHAILKKILLMIPLVVIIVGASVDFDTFEGWFGNKSNLQVMSDNDTASLFPKIWICPKTECGYSNYDGISNCALCGTPRS